MHVSVTAIGADRPGIVAAVTRVLVDRNCNIEDSRMAILGGHFSMMLVVKPAEGLDAAGLEAALSPAVTELGLTLDVRPIEDLHAARPIGAPHVLSVYGSDRPGIVHDVSEALAHAGVNIVDLRTHVTSPARENESPVYIMLMDLEVPGDPAALEQRLKELADSRGIDVTLRPADAETL
jgi:glycine cleavage system transcriptional repressor